MNAEQRETFRQSLLDVMSANGSEYGLSLKALAALLRGYGIRPTPRELLDELTYLRDKGLTTQVNKKISPEVGAWRITAEGRDWLATNGF